MNETLPTTAVRAGGEPAAHSVLNLSVWGGLLLLFIAGLLAVVASELRNGYENRLASATTDTARLGRILEAQVESVMLRADTILEHIAEETAEKTANPHNPGLDRYLEKINRRFPELAMMRVLNAEGCAVASSTDQDSAPCYPDRDYFTRQRDEPGFGLYISEPLFGRTSRDWQLMLSRRISHPDGSFAGAVTARLELSYFESMFKSAQLGRGYNVTLLGGDFRVITRYPLDEGQRLKSVMGGPVERATRTHPSEGTVSGISTVDGVDRILNYRRIGDYPFYIVVGVAKSDVLTEWRKNAAIEIAVASLLLAAIGLLAYHLLRRFRAEQEIRSRLHEIALTMGEGLYVVDGQDRIVFVNPEISRILGWEARELLGRNAHQLFHHHQPDGTDYPEERCEIASAIRKGDMFRSDDATLWRKDGTPVPVSLISSPIERGGQQVGSVVTFQDVTRRKQAEQQLKSLNENLERRVEEEVARNLEKERLLIQQNRLATMGEMIGNIAHQWRQPLNVLSLLLANVKDAYTYNELDKETLESAVNQGHQMLQKMSSTIDDFRDFFRPNKEKERFELGDSVRDAITLVQASLKGHAIEIVVEGGEVLRVQGYPNELSQVLLNLFTNAKEALVERQVSGGKIIVAWERDGARARLRVRDNAGGIPAGLLPKIFDPYFTTKEKGTGIGLYMSKMIAEHMEGAITAENVEEGAEFTVSLPLAT